MNWVYEFCAVIGAIGMIASAVICVGALVLFAGKKAAFTYRETVAHKDLIEAIREWKDRNPERAKRYAKDGEQ